MAENSPLSVSVGNVRGNLSDCTSFAQSIRGKLFGWPAETGALAKGADAVEPAELSWGIASAQAKLEELRDLLANIDSRI